MSTAPDNRQLLQRALTTIERLQARLAERGSGSSEPIAIIGMACRMPGGASTPEAYWELLRQGVDAVTEVPPERWNVDEYYDPDPDALGKSYSRWGAFLRDIDKYDAAFFGNSPREAIAMDPQHRLLLEVAWEALERAGQAPARVAGSRTGVYIGMAAMDYAFMQMRNGEVRDLDLYFGTGTCHSQAAGRLSYVLDLRGPSVAIDTACSSSLLAVHQACQNLRAGESDMALAGGVNVMLCPDGAVATSRARMMSFTGRCHTFDAAADGYVRAEGCGLLVLKRLSDAVAARDPILAVIQGSAANQDGRSNGLTAPNPRAQIDVIRAALQDAQCSPAQVSFVEAHGTGTTLGDPIEMGAIGDAYCQGRSSSEPLWVASVKTNVGHLEAAAGIAGLMKLILALQHRELPPHLHFKAPNPYIDWQSLPVRIPVALTPWECGTEPLRAGISSFGFSGTNVHMIVTEAPLLPATTGTTERPVHLLPLSARTPEALGDLADRYLQFLESSPAAFAQIAHTAAAGRAHFPHRLAVVATDALQAREYLTQWRAGRICARAFEGHAGVDEPGIVFLFTGQGSQYPGMGAELYRTQPVFRDAMDRCDGLLRPVLERSLTELLYGDDAGNRTLLEQTKFTQPALFAYEYALSQLWLSWGVRPVAVLGHSVGEYVAACIAGVFCLEDALQLVAARGALMQGLPAGGGMLAVHATEAAVRECLDLERNPSVAVAALNGPTNTVLAGPLHLLSGYAAVLQAHGVDCTPLRVSHAFHSPLMQPMLAAFRAVLERIQLHRPTLEFASNLTGAIDPEAGASVDYWLRHVMAPVRFEQGMRALAQGGARHFLEIGPMPVLGRLAAQFVEAKPAALWLSSAQRGLADTDVLLQAAAQLYAAGAPLDWRAFDAHWRRACIVAPTYPFQRQSYWLDLATRSSRQAVSPAPASAHPLLGDLVSGPRPAFACVLAADAPAWIADHRIFGTILFPATGFLELMRAAALEVAQNPHGDLLDATVQAPLDLGSVDGFEVQTTVHVIAADLMEIQVHSRPQRATARDPWTLHASARMTAVSKRVAERIDLTALRERMSEPVDLPAFRSLLVKQGADYGPSFQGIGRAVRRGFEVVSDVALPDPSLAVGYGLHPALLDACLQLLGIAVQDLDTTGSERDPFLFLPLGIGSYRLHRPGCAAVVCHATVEPSAQADSLIGRLALFDAEGTAVAELRDIELRRVRRSQVVPARTAARQSAPLLEPHWHPLAAHAPHQASFERGWDVVHDGSALASELLRSLRNAGAEARDLAVRRDFADLPQSAHANLIVVFDTVQSFDGQLASLEGNILTHVRTLLACRPLLSSGQGRVWMIFRGAKPWGTTLPDPALAPIWSAGGVLAAEFDQWRCKRVDLDPVEPLAATVQTLLAELTCTDDEDQILLRGGARFAARLRPARAPAPTAKRLTLSGRGSLSQLQLIDQVPRPPGPGEVLLRVRATGLNFRDVLNVLDMYPGDAGTLGSECAGTIVALGAGVTNFSVGDDVLGLVDDSFATWCTVRPDVLVRKPPALGFNEAATVPIAFLTALYALRHLAGIRRGERVLIHAITGGVGMAAAQLARLAGAEVLGTAGSPAKRELARALGARHVADSRSLAFEQDVMRATGGEGVDIVLNCLAGEFIPASLRCLRRGGRFVEIGKSGIWDASKVAAQYPHVDYRTLYLGEIAQAEPSVLRTLLAEILEHVVQERLRPLPHRAAPVAQAESVFRTMAQGQHTGKLVLTQQVPGEVRADATYLVTGGLGALGLMAAQCLAEAGALSLVLVGRRPPDAQACAIVRQLEDRGVAVQVRSADIADAEQVSSLLKWMKSSLPVLRGIIHAAGVVHDGLLVDLDADAFRQVLAPKLRGAYLLHELTRELPLDFFVLYSAGAAVFGSAGQANYAAANASLDGLAQQRAAIGLPATSINWGAWAGEGMAEKVTDHHRRRWKSAGLSMIEAEEGKHWLHEVLTTVIAPQVVVVPMDRARVAASGNPLFRGLHDARTAASAAAAGSQGPALDLVGASASQIEATVLAVLTEQLRKVLALPSSMAIDPARPLVELGIDSLMAVELRNRLRSALGVSVTIAELLQGVGIHRLAAQLVVRFSQHSEQQRGSTGAPVDDDAPAWEDGSL